MKLDRLSIVVAGDWYGTQSIWLSSSILERWSVCPEVEGGSPSEATNCGVEQW